MTEAPDLSDKRFEELEDELTCAVCHGHYQEARLLPCMHYYCRACIEKLAERSRGRPFPCPECRKDTTLPSGSAEQLQSAFFVERMKDLYGKMAKAEGKVEAVCESCCLKGKAIAFCRQCTAFLCAHCVEQHKTLRILLEHKVATLEDLKRGGALHISLKETPLPKCPEHDELMKMFCFDCNRLICRDCTVIDHNGHNFNFLKKCATDSRKSLRDSLTPLRKVQANILGADEKLVATETEVDKQEKEVCQVIKRSFAELKAILEQRETELLNKAVTLAREKKDALKAQRKDLQMVDTKIQSLVDFVERNVENTSDQDLMVVCTQLQTKVEEEEKRYQQLSLEPATIADIAYNSPSADAIWDLGEVFRLSQLSLETDLLSIQLGKPFKVTLKAPDHRNPTIQAELKSLVDPASSVEADVFQERVGVHNITCAPRVRGRHDLMVKVNGRDIVGSPFRVFVKIHPTQLGSPVRTITGVKMPYGIALNNSHQLVVAEWGGKKVSIIERNGKIVQAIECDKFQHPCGVATGPDGAIYITDGPAKSLFKFNKEGRLLKTVQHELEWPLFIKTIKNGLYVSDSHSKLVKIFDTDCNLIGTISTTECLKLYDIAEGDNGLYVVGDKIGVYSCTPNGKFIHHLDIKPSVTLSGLKGICFDCSGHLFITQCGAGVEGMYVFTSTGEHVATFGQASSRVSMGVPSGIVIDEDGFVYVCDFNSSKNRVVVF